MSPYIPQGERDNTVGSLMRHYGRVGACGNLNYTITKMCLEYLSERTDGPHYAGFNEVVGVLECVKQEFYRRMVAPYEDEACKRNGDVFK